MENNKVQESESYENCMELLTDEYQPPTLNRFFGEDEDSDEDGVDIHNAEWKKHWVGMPAFEQNEKKTFKTIYLHFRNQEDYEAFAKLVDQNLTMKTKSIWYPKLERDENSLKRWIED
jgi:hypothetical protein